MRKRWGMSKIGLHGGNSKWCSSIQDGERRTEEGRASFIWNLEQIMFKHWR